MKRYIIFAYCIVSFSCADNNSIKEGFVEIDEDCIHIKELTISSNNPYVEFSLESSNEEVHLILDSILDYSNCDSTYVINYMLNGEPLKLLIVDRRSRCMETGKDNVIECLVNEQGEILFDNKLISLSELENKVTSTFSNHSSFERIHLDWQTSAPIELVTKALVSIKKGYEYAIESKALNDYNSTVCELNDEDYNSLKAELAFNLSIKQSYMFSPVKVPTLNISNPQSHSSEDSEKTGLERERN